jgi:hypothetical protein
LVVVEFESNPVRSWVNVDCYPHIGTKSRLAYKFRRKSKMGAGDGNERSVCPLDSIVSFEFFPRHTIKFPRPTVVCQEKNQKLGNGSLFPSFPFYDICDLVHWDEHGAMD